MASHITHSARRCPPPFAASPLDTNQLRPDIRADAIDHSIVLTLRSPIGPIETERLPGPRLIRPYRQQPCRELLPSPSCPSPGSRSTHSPAWQGLPRRHPRVALPARSAEQAIHKLRGVVNVRNSIRAKPSVAAFRRNAQLDADSTSIEEHHGEVTLRGRVHSWAASRPTALPGHTRNIFRNHTQPQPLAIIRGAPRSSTMPFFTPTMHRLAIDC